MPDDFNITGSCQCRAVRYAVRPKKISMSLRNNRGGPSLTTARSLTGYREVGLGVIFGSLRRALRRMGGGALSRFPPCARIVIAVMADERCSIFRDEPYWPATACPPSTR